MSIWKKFIRDPIFHFLLIAIALFAVDAYSTRSVDAQKVIEVDQARIEWLKSASKKENGRLPTDGELQRLIDNHVRDEVFFREALAMGLERDDVIIRRRLVEKLRFLIEDVATSTVPGEQELREFYQLMQDSFREPERYSFSHFYFSNDARSDARSDAEQALLQLTGSGAEPAKKLGDPFMMRYHYANQGQSQIGNSFGSDFALDISKLAAGPWSGPLQSVYGWHLVKLNEKTASYIPDFEQVREEVLAQWQEQQRVKANDEIFARLRAGYSVRILPGQEPE